MKFLLPKALFLLVSALMLSHCTEAGEESPWIVLGNRVDASVIRSLQKDLGLVVIGLGGSAYDGIREVAACFSTSALLEFSDARALIVNVLYRFIEAYNRTEAVHEYLNQFPPSPDMFSLAIFSYPGKNSTVAVIPYVGCISNRKGMIRYQFAIDPAEPNWAETITESYEEALEIVKAQGKLLPFDPKILAR